jgi:hypothetical protein
MRSLIRQLFMGTVLSLAMWPSTGDAQKQPNRGAHSVTLIEVGSLPSGKRAMVIRRAGGIDTDVIALTATSTGRDLTAATQLLNAVRVRFGDTPAHDIVVAVNGDESLLPIWKDQEAVDRGSLDQLRRARTRRVRGFGNVRALDISVPNVALRVGSSD